jgi:hypothetical protein
MTRKPYVMPDWMALWGEADPAREYREAERRGSAALTALLERRQAREAPYWAAIRAAQEAERVRLDAAAIELERAGHAADQRAYRARVKARRLADRR